MFDSVFVVVIRLGSMLSCWNVKKLLVWLRLYWILLVISSVLCVCSSCWVLVRKLGGVIVMFLFWIGLMRKLVMLPWCSWCSSVLRLLNGIVLLGSSGLNFL